MGESGSEVSHFIPELRNFSEFTKLSDYKKKPWIKANLNKVNNLINSQTFLVEYPEKYDPVTPFMDYYKSKTQYDGIIDKIKLRIVVRGYL